MFDESNKSITMCMCVCCSRVFVSLFACVRACVRVCAKTRTRVRVRARGREGEAQGTRHKAQEVKLFNWNILTCPCDDRISVR